jgi:hypothetical protein
MSDSVPDAGSYGDPFQLGPDLRVQWPLTPTDELFAEIHALVEVVVAT